MIHNYFDVDIEVLWTTKNDLPKLKQQTDRLLIDLKKRDASLFKAFPAVTKKRQPIDKLKDKLQQVIFGRF